MLLRRASFLWRPAVLGRIVQFPGKDYLPVHFYAASAAVPMKPSRLVRDAVGQPLTIDITEAAEEVPRPLASLASRPSP